MIHATFVEQQMRNIVPVLAPKLEMADEDMLLSLCSANVDAVVMKRRQRKPKKTQNLDSRMAGKQNVFRCILRTFGGTPKVILDVATNRDLLIVPSNMAITADALSLTSRFL